MAKLLFHSSGFILTLLPAYPSSDALRFAFLSSWKNTTKDIEVRAPRREREKERVKSIPSLSLTLASFPSLISSIFILDRCPPMKCDGESGICLWYSGDPTGIASWRVAEELQFRENDDIPKRDQKLDSLI